MSDKNINVIKHIQVTGKCPEDATMATSMYSESGFQPKADSKYAPKKSIDTNPPPVPTKGSSAVPPTKKVGIEIDYSNNLFDPNEKDPAMRALNMVKEYCKISLKELQEKPLELQNKISQQRTYVDVISFIEDHQNKCLAAKQLEVFEDQDLKHLTNQRDWFQKRMKDYKDSFFRVCDIVEHSDCADIIKKLIEEERKRY